MYILIIMLVGGVLGGVISQNKGRNVFFWTIFCGLIPLTLLILLALPKLAQVGLSRPCPFCLRIIPWHASICSYCQAKVPTPHTHPCPFCGGALWVGESHCSTCGKAADTKPVTYKKAQDKG